MASEGPHENGAADPKHSIRAAQASADAALHAQFEAGGEATFDYTASVDASRNITLAQPAGAPGGGPPGTAGVDPAAGVSVTAYLARMQRGGLIQSFGCMMLLEEETFKVLAFSENAPQMLGLLEPPPRATPTAGSPTHSADFGSPTGSPGGSPAAGSPVREHHASGTNSIKKRRDPLGAAFRSLSIKIHNAIHSNKTRGRRAPDAPGAGAPETPEDGKATATSPSSPGPGTPVAGAPGSPLARTSSGGDSSEVSGKEGRSPSGKWNPFRRLASAGSSPLASPRHGHTPAAPAAHVPEAPAGKPAPRLELGASAKALFTPDSFESIRKVAAAADVSMMNPLLVQSVGNGMPGAECSFYAIFHRKAGEGLHMDLEPIRPEDPIFMSEGALQAHRLAAKAIAKLQRVPAGHLRELCETVVGEVRSLTGYDRIMAYKFHEDEHGEVLAEARRKDMEPYLGLHYPATDIPQAARFLFMKNRVRIIVNCAAENVPVVQDEARFPQPIVLSNSTLRAVHGCHAQYMQNMGTLGSIGMAVIVNDSEAKEAKEETDRSLPVSDKGRKLWGLVVCHHEEARYLPYPLRLACEFLMQVFSMKVNMEIEMGAQEKEKCMLKTQTLLCDMLQRDAPVGIMTQYPNITDLVKCDGAALLFGGKFWQLGSTPTHGQMRDIVRWLQTEHGESAGFSTDSLKDSGYPKAEELGDTVCGMIAAQLIGEDYLFWFRAPVEKEIAWHGAKHQAGERDDGRRMNPRSSFAAFLEVVRHRSTPWDDIEIDAVSSLILILRGHLTSFSAGDLRGMENARLSNRDTERLSIAESELSRILETATAPVFTVDKLGCVTAWNARLAQLTGLTAGEVLGVSLIGELVSEAYRGAAASALAAALCGQEVKSIELHLKKFAPRGLRRHGSSTSTSSGFVPPSPGASSTCSSTSTWALEDSAGEVVLLLNAFISRGGLLEDDTELGEGEEPRGKGEVSGVCFMGQDLTAQKVVEGHFTKVQGDYAAIVHSGNSLIPPIFAIDASGHCAEWNPAMEKLAGVGREEALGEMLLGTLFGGALRMKAADRTKLMIVLNKSLSGNNTECYPLAFLSRQGQLVETLLTVNARRDAASDEVLGAFCFLHTASAELQAALRMQRAAEEFAETQAKTVAYVRQEIKAPLDGLKWARSRMEAFPQVGETGPARQALNAAVRCEQLLTRMLGDDSVENLEEGFLGLENDEYRLDTVVDTVVSMGQAACTRRGVAFECECREDITQKAPLRGDAMRLQQALADFVCSAAQFTPEGGRVTLRVITGARGLFQDPNFTRCEFRVLHSGPTGVPVPIVKQMLEPRRADDKAAMTQEGLGLSVSRRIILTMDGDVQYDRLPRPNESEFVVRMALPIYRDASSCATPKAASPARFQGRADISGLAALADGGRMVGMEDMQVDIIPAC